MCCMSRSRDVRTSQVKLSATGREHMWKTGDAVRVRDSSAVWHIEQVFQLTIDGVTYTCYECWCNQGRRQLRRICEAAELAHHRGPFSGST